MNTADSDLITLSCPTCGGKLQITDHIERFVCAHCRNEHLVRREGGMIFLSPLVEGIRHIRTGVDKTAAELAVARLLPQINELTERQETLGATNLNVLVPPSDIEKMLRWSILIVPILILVVYGNVLLAVIAFIGFLAWYGKAAIGRTNKAQALKDDELDKIAAQLESKSKAYHHSLQLVDS